MNKKLGTTFRLSTWTSLLYDVYFKFYKRTYGARNLKFELSPNRVSQNTFFDTLNTMVQQKIWFEVVKPGSWEDRFLEIGPCLSQDIPNQKRKHNTNRSTSVKHQLYHLNHRRTSPKSHSTTTLLKKLWSLLKKLWSKRL